MANPQAGIHIVLVTVDEAQLHLRGGVDKHDGMGEILLAEFQQILFVLVQLQVSGAGQGGAVPVVVHGGGSALSTGAGEGHNGIIGVAVGQDVSLAVFVNRDVKLMNFLVACPVVQTGGVAGANTAATAHSILQPIPCVLVHVQTGFYKCVRHQHGIQVVQAAGRAGAAFHIVIRHGSQQRHFCPFCQGKDTILVFQQDSALAFQLHADIIALSVAVVCIIVSGTDRCCREIRQQHGQRTNRCQDFLSDFHC